MLSSANEHSKTAIMTKIAANVQEINIISQQISRFRENVNNASIISVKTIFRHLEVVQRMFSRGIGVVLPPSRNNMNECIVCTARKTEASSSTVQCRMGIGFPIAPFLSCRTSGGMAPSRLILSSFQFHYACLSYFESILLPRDSHYSISYNSATGGRLRSQWSRVYV